MIQHHEIIATLKRFKFPGAIANLDIRLKEVQENELGHMDFLYLVLQDELLSRESNNLEKRIRSAGFMVQLTFEQFDFNFNREALQPNIIRDLATCHFIERKENLVLCGPPGIGKSHIACAIGHEACRRQMEVLFRKTSKLIEELTDPLYPKRCAKLLKRALSCDLLILDDFAFRRYSQEESEVLYTLADDRLGKKSTIITSNRPTEEWYGIFPDPVIGGALMDRLVSGAIKIVVTKGKSYRKEKNTVAKKEK